MMLRTSPFVLDPTLQTRLRGRQVRRARVLADQQAKASLSTDTFHSCGIRRPGSRGGEVEPVSRAPRIIAPPSVASPRHEALLGDLFPQTVPGMLRPNLSNLCE